MPGLIRRTNDVANHDRLREHCGLLIGGYELIESGDRAFIIRMDDFDPSDWDHVIPDQLLGQVVET